MNILIGILTGIHVLVALFLIILVLMQKSQEQGVGAAFGGGVTDTVFGGGTPTALSRMTIWCACILLATTLVLAVLHSQRRGGRGSLMQKALQTTPATQTASPAVSQPPALPTPEATQPAVEPAPAAATAETVETP